MTTNCTIFKRKRSFLLVLFFITIAPLLIAPVSFLAECQANELADRFQQEGPQGWKRLSSAYDEFRATMSVTRKIVNKAKQKTLNFNLKHIYKQKKEHQLVEVINTAPNSPSRVFSVNPKYGFQLRPATQSGPERQWIIAEASPSYTNRANLPSMIDEMTHSIFEYPWTITIMPLATVVTSSGFQIKNIIEIGATSELPAAVALEFDYAPVPGDKISVMEGARGAIIQAGPPTLSGTMTLIPEYDWALVDYNVQATFNLVGKGLTDPLHMSSKAEYELKEALNGTTVPVPMRLSQTLSRETLDREIVCNVDNWDFVSIDDSEFTLSAYDLPEVGVDIRKPSLGQNILLAANCCLVASLAIWIVSKKLKKLNNS